MKKRTRLADVLQSLILYALMCRSTMSLSDCSRLTVSAPPPPTHLLPCLDIGFRKLRPRHDSRTPEQVGQKCNIQWDLDTTGTWTSFEIQLMTGSNLNMVRRFGLDLGEGNLS